MATASLVLGSGCQALLGHDVTLYLTNDSDVRHIVRLSQGGTTQEFAVAPRTSGWIYRGPATHVVFELLDANCRSQQVSSLTLSGDDIASISDDGFGFANGREDLSAVSSSSQIGAGATSCSTGSHWRGGSWTASLA